MYQSILAIATVAAISANGGATLRPNEVERLQSAAKTVQDVRNDIPEEYWERARCVVVIPELKKAAFIIGGEYGKGVTICRAGEGWSAPLFLQLAKGSWGFQAGAQQIDLVLLIMNESGVQKLLQDKVTLGADASVAAGPVGRQGSVATDVALKAEILSYSRAQGLFAGIDLSGGVLRPDGDANKDAYGPNASPRAVLASREISAPPQATPLLDALKRASVRSTASSAPATTDRVPRSSEALAGTSSRSTTDPDIRAIALDLQQTIDRMLADTTRSSVGTSGAAGANASGEMVVVDRARLLQLRQQLGQLIAALNGR